jgi:hypothetical protein
LPSGGTLPVYIRPQGTCGAALAFAQRCARLAEIVLGRGPLRRHALAGEFLQRIAIGGDGARCRAACCSSRPVVPAVNRNKMDKSASDQAEAKSCRRRFSYGVRSYSMDIKGINMEM